MDFSCLNGIGYAALGMQITNHRVHAFNKAVLIFADWITMPRWKVASEQLKTENIIASIAHPPDARPKALRRLENEMPRKGI